MSIEKNPGRSAPTESLSKTAENAIEEELRASEEEARLAEVVDAIKGEFSNVATRISNLENSDIGGENFEKVLFIADRLSTLAEISPSLASRPDLRKEFDDAVRYVSSEFIRIMEAKYPRTELSENQKAEFVAALRKLDQSLDALGPKASADR
ncbi:MAG: hypothetical protein QMC36_08080 [Patescibacteria group bacterium]